MRTPRLDRTVLTCLLRLPRSLALDDGSLFSSGLSSSESGTSINVSEPQRETRFRHFNDLPLLHFGRPAPSLAGPCTYRVDVIVDPYPSSLSRSIESTSRGLFLLTVLLGFLFLGGSVHV